MNKLNDLSIYLPFSLKYNSMGEFEKQEYIDLEPKPSVFIMKGLNGLWVESECLNNSFISDCFPLLRHLDDLKTDIEIDGEFINPYSYLELEKYLPISTFSEIKYWIEYLPYKIVVKLIEWHFDIAGLIEEKKAIKIN